MSYKEISDDGVWTIPAERHKSKRPHHVPLSKEALTLIAASCRLRLRVSFPGQDSIHTLRQEQGRTRPGCIQRDAETSEKRSEGRAFTELDPS
jgi:integrase